jgi:acetyl esterase/lipase
LERIRQKIFAILLTFFCFYSCSAQAAAFLQSADVTAMPSKPADHRLAYGADPSQYGDLRLPKGKGPFPVAIILHGGCWISSLATADNTSPLADALRDQGVATWNVEYRGIDNGGGWPVTFQDVAAAADYLTKIAVKYSLDLHHVIAVGHSAGGHLALWLAARHKLPTTSVLYTKHPLPISAVVTLGGIGDLQAYNAQPSNPCGKDTILQLLGNDPDLLTKRYLEASPAALLPLGVPQILIHGSDDTIVPPNFGDDYVTAAKNSGDNAQIIIISDSAHHEYIAPGSIAWPAVKKAILSTIVQPPTHTLYSAPSTTYH